MIDDVTDVSRMLHERADALRFQPLDPDQVIRRGQSTHFRRRLAAGSLLLVSTAAAIVVAIVGSGSTDAERPARVVPVSQAPTPAATSSPTSPPPPSYSPPPIPAGWAALPTAPEGSGVGFAGSARVGTSIAYWGGDGPDEYTDRGAVLDVSSHAWSGMSTSPLEGRSTTAIAGSDQLLFVWGGGRLGTKVYADGATYNVVTREWRKVSQAPLSARVPLGSVWTGSEFLVVGESTATQQHDPVADGAAYNPATNTWRSIPSLPTALTSASVLHASGQTVVMGTDAKPNAFGSNFLYVLTDGASAWRTYSPPSNMESATLTATTDGTTIFAAARRQYLKAAAPEPLLVMAFDFGSGAWQDLNNPFNPPECYPRLAATAKGIWEFGCTASRYDRATQTWRQLEVPSGTPIVVGSEIAMSGYAIRVDS